MSEIQTSLEGKELFVDLGYRSPNEFQIEVSYLNDPLTGERLGFQVNIPNGQLGPQIISESWGLETWKGIEFRPEPEIVIVPEPGAFQLLTLVLVLLGAWILIKRGGFK